MMSAKMAARLVAEDFAIEPAIVGGRASVELNYR
jgi:hypothetical protein